MRPEQGTMQVRGLRSYQVDSMSPAHFARPLFVEVTAIALVRGQLPPHPQDRDRRHADCCATRTIVSPWPR